MQNSRWSDIICFLSKLSGFKILNFFLLKFSYHYSILTGKYFHRGLPAFLSIEPSSVCQLKCVECPTGRGEIHRERKYFPYTDFQKIIAENAKSLLSVTLSFQGEPFLNPEIFKFIEFASGSGIYVQTYTNAHNLTEDYCKKIVDAGLNRIVISFDGADAHTYINYRQAGSFEVVVAGIKNLVKARSESSKNRLQIICQCLLTKETENQLEQIKTTALKLGADKCVFKTLMIHELESPVAGLPSEAKYSRYEKVDNKLYHKSVLPNKCFRIWSGLVVASDGNIAPCCFDKQTKYAFGNLTTNNLLIIWKGEKLKNMRKSIFQNRKNIDICTNCTEGLTGIIQNG